MDNININEVTQTTTYTSNKIGILIRQIILYTSAAINVYFYDANGSVFKVEELLMEGEDYANWASNDDYIRNFVCSKLNLTPVYKL